MNRRSFLGVLLALPFAPTLAKMLPKPVREFTGLEQALVDAAALVQRDHGPDLVYVNFETYRRLEHFLEYGEHNRDQCAQCVAWDTAALKARLLAKHRPQPMEGYDGIWSK